MNVCPVLSQSFSLPSFAMPRRDAAPLVRIRLIGQMEAWSAGGVSILPVGRKTRGLLAILALAAPRLVIRSRLAELLWSRRLEEQARASLRQEVHRLGEALEPAGQEIVRAARDHLSLRSDLVWVDVHEALRAPEADPSALSLLDEPLLEDFDGIDPAFDQWLAAERQRLRNHGRSVAETLMRQHPEPEAVIPVAMRLLASDRMHEGAWRGLMAAYAGRGERGLATQAYERCKAALADGMKTAPSLETQRLAADIRAGTLPRPDLSSPDLAGSGLPGPELPSPGLPRPELPRPELPSPGLPRPELPRPEMSRPEMPRPEMPDLDERGRLGDAVRVGILPLQKIGAEDGERVLAAGLAEEVTAALAPFRWIVLVSASSLAKAGMRDDAALGRAFALDFLLGGSVQLVGERCRVTMRLLDLREGNQVVWTRRFDRGSTDLASMQEDIAAEVAAQIEPEMLLIGSRRAARRPPADSTAHDLVLRAVPMITRLRRDEFTEAGLLLNRALALHPDYAAAHAWRAYWALHCLSQGWADHTGMTEEAGHHAECAIMLDPQDARGLSIAGHVRAFLHRRRREAMALYSRALSFNPNLAMGWGLSAMNCTYLGEWDEAARRFARYKRLSPADPNAYVFEAGMARLELGRGNDQAAVLAGRRASGLNPFFTSGLKHYLAALGHAAMLTEAASVRVRLLAIEPGYTVSTALCRNPYEHAVDMARYAAGLRLAGLPE